MPKLNIAVIWKPILERYVVKCESKNRHQKDMMCLQRDWTTCWIFVNQSRPNSQHDWGNLYDQSMRIFNLMTNKIFIWPPIITRPMATGTIWICSASRASCVFHFYEWWMQREKCPNNTHPTSTIKRLLFRVKFQVPTWIATAYDQIASLLGDVLVNKLLQCTVSLVPIKNLEIVGVSIVPILFVMISQYPSTLLLGLLAFLLLRLSSLLLGCHFLGRCNDIKFEFKVWEAETELMATGPKWTSKYKKPDLGSDFPSYKTCSLWNLRSWVNFVENLEENCQRLCWKHPSRDYR